MSQKPGLYLHLFHGRAGHPGRPMNDWGPQGPVFGPFAFVQTTYATHVKPTLENEFGEQEDFPEWFTIVDDCLYYDGVFYGDWSVSIHPGHEPGMPEVEKMKPPEGLGTWEEWAAKHPEDAAPAGENPWTVITFAPEEPPAEPMETCIRCEKSFPKAKGGHFCVPLSWNKEERERELAARKE